MGAPTGGTMAKGETHLGTLWVSVIAIAFGVALIAYLIFRAVTDLG